MTGLPEPTVGHSDVRAMRSRDLSERDLLLFLAACLSMDHSAAAIDRLRRRVRSNVACWPQIIAFTNHELLAPTLWVALQEKGVTGDLPEESAARLRRAHAVNRVRSDRFRSELEAIIRCLNAVGIAPVLMKGAVDLFISRYSDPAARILRDLDLLVLKPEHDRAVEALLGAGYQVVARDAAWTTYSTDLTRPGAMAAVDLQWFVSAQRDVLAPEEAWRSSVVHRVGDLEFRTLSAEHQIVHNLLHSELQDRGGDAGFVWLRQLLDFVALCRLHGSTIDWSRVCDRFAGRGLRHLPVARLYMAQQLLGLPMPLEIRPTLAARLHYRRCLAQLRWRWPMVLSRWWATITSPLDARLLDVVYGVGEGRRDVARIRIRHGLRLLAHYRGNLPGIIRKRRTKFD